MENNLKMINDDEYEVSYDLDSLISFRKNEKYDERFSELAKGFLMLNKGATSKDLASFLNISETTLVKWIREKPSFAMAVNLGKNVADVEVVNSLYQNATTGYTYEEEVAFFDKTTGQTIVQTVKRHKPADIKAQQFWLSHRKSDSWSESARSAAPVETTYIIDDGLDDSSPELLSDGNNDVDEPLK